MSCVLRAWGTPFDVDAFLGGDCTFSAVKIWYAGGPAFPGSRGTVNTNGFIAELSSADFDDLEAQVSDTIGFLERHNESLCKLVAWPGVDAAFCDFGIRLRSRAPMQRTYLPAELLKAMARVGLGLQISAYAISNEHEDHS